MTYQVGTHIDLSHINRAQPSVDRSTIQTIARQFVKTEFTPGESIDLSFINRQVDVLKLLVSQAQIA